MNNWQLSFIAGCTFSLFFPSMPDFFWFLMSFLLLCYAVYRKSLNSSAFFLGTLYLVAYFFLLVKWDLPVDSHQRSSIIRGNVISTTAKGDCSHFTLKVEQSSPFPTPFLAPQIRLFHQIADFCPSIGDSLTLQIRMKPVQLLLNESVTRFPSSEYFNRRLTKGTVQRVLSQTAIEPSQRIRWLRSINDDLLMLQHRGVLLALMFGEKNQLSEATRQRLRIHGIGHLLAISGLHVGLIFFFSFTLVGVLLRYVRGISFGWALAIKLFTAFGFALFYSYLAGFAVSTVRAIAMLGIVCVFLLLRRKTSALAIVNTVNVAVVIVYPLTLFSMAYWLSFGAVYLILLQNVCFPSKKLPQQQTVTVLFRHWLSQLFRLQCCLFLGLMPLSLLFFDGFALNGLLSNLVAIPVISFLVIPLVLIALLCWLLGSTTMAYFGWKIADEITHWLFLVLDKMNWFDWSAMTVSTPLVFVALWLVPLLLLKVFRVPVLLLFVTLLGRQVAQWQHHEQQLLVHILAIGQGTAIVIQRGTEAILYDVGPAFPPFYDSASAILLPWLHAHGIQSIEMVILSHGDNDHSGAATTLLAAIPVGNLVVSQPIIEDDDKKRHLQNALQLGGSEPNHVSLCKALETSWREVSVKAVMTETVYHSSNDNSCVVRLQFGEHVVLLPGDISKAVELALVRQQQGLLQASVLIAPHHGSQSSSSWTFIHRVQPAHVVFTTGYRNRFKFPKASVVKRYEHAGVSTWDTGKDGQITFEIPQEGPIQVKTARTHYLASWLYQHGLIHVANIVK